MERPLVSQLSDVVFPMFPSMRAVKEWPRTRETERMVGETCLRERLWFLMSLEHLKLTRRCVICLPLQEKINKYRQKELEETLHSRLGVKKNVSQLTSTSTA